MNPRRVSTIVLVTFRSLGHAPGVEAVKYRAAEWKSTPPMDQEP